MLVRRSVNALTRLCTRRTREIKPMDMGNVIQPGGQVSRQRAQFQFTHSAISKNIPLPHECCIERYKSALSPCVEAPVIGAGGWLSVRMQRDINLRRFVLLRALGALNAVNLPESGTSGTLRSTKWPHSLFQVILTSKRLMGFGARGSEPVFCAVFADNVGDKRKRMAGQIPGDPLSALMCKEGRKRVRETPKHRVARLKKEKKVLINTLHFKLISCQYVKRQTVIILFQKW